jgi:hypothetical protein
MDQSREDRLVKKRVLGDGTWRNCVESLVKSDYFPEAGEVEDKPKTKVSLDSFLAKFSSRD